MWFTDLLSDEDKKKDLIDRTEAAQILGLSDKELGRLSSSGYLMASAIVTDTSGRMHSLFSRQAVEDIAREMQRVREAINRADEEDKRLGEVWVSKKEAINLTGSTKNDINNWIRLGKIRSKLRPDKGNIMGRWVGLVEKQEVIDYVIGKYELIGICAAAAVFSTSVTRVMHWIDDGKIKKYEIDGGIYVSQPECIRARSRNRIVCIKEV